ncbi:MAG TPA: hypothetical protein VGP48_10705, partial [Stellaceae bacterium]|nr:hypothetical protein [Stellaceae bacterium]
GTTVRQLADIIAELCEISPDFIYRDPRPGDVRVSVGDSRRAFREFGVRARLPLSEGLKNTIAAARNRTRLQRRYAGG